MPTLKLLPSRIPRKNSFHFISPLYTEQTAHSCNVCTTVIRRLSRQEPRHMDGLHFTSLVTKMLLLEQYEYCWSTILKVCSMLSLVYWNVHCILMEPHIHSSPRHWFQSCQDWRQKVQLTSSPHCKSKRMRCRDSQDALWSISTGAGEEEFGWRYAVWEWCRARYESAEPRSDDAGNCISLSDFGSCSHWLETVKHTTQMKRRQLLCREDTTQMKRMQLFCREDILILTH